MKSISLKNFKQFNDLQIDGFKRINLISGLNNSGKSSLIEAVYTISCINDRTIFPIFIHGLITRQSQQINTANDSNNFIDRMKSLFYKFDFSNDVVIKYELISCMLKYKELRPEELVFEEYSGKKEVINPDSRVITVDVVADETKMQASIFATRGRMESKVLDKSVPCLFIDENNIIKDDRNQNSIINELSKIIDDNLEKDLVNNALKIFDEGILSIAISVLNQTSQIMIEHKDFTSKIPLISYGGGVKKVLNIIMCIMRCKDGVVLIDEIENGIHYSIVPKLWKIIFELTQKYNCQIFATTHSKEYTNYITEETTGWKEHKDEFCFITLNKYNSKIIPSVYDGSQFEGALDFNNELRG